MSVQVNRKTGWLSQVGNSISSYWTKAQQEGSTQITVNTEIRSVIGIYSTYCFPGAAIAGATAANLAPEKVKLLTDMLEGAVTGISKKLTVTQKLALSALGIGCVTICDPTMIFRTLAVVFALKLGMEYGNRNLKKEVRNQVEKKATENLPQVD